ncbi:MAG TPA: hypothetical protein VMT80_01945 [Candidatus Paceibacterota bacterium]|nr:hypothetical protein [Candidatus Paceibacterota bacterium]
MHALAGLLIFCQALGAVGGAASAVWGEIEYARAIRDGNIDAAERAHLKSIARGLRYGMSLLLVSSIGLVILAFEVASPVAPALTASYWAFISLSLLIVAVTWALSRKRLSFAVGSASAFTAWWFLAYLTLGQFPQLSFGASVALYVVSTAVLYALLRYARILIIARAKKSA